ncbi:MAG: molybdopterin-dependent oxidoreductase [Chloroflexota bacterium]|nr:molybdopterin-dependent oxidoreductase [Chloroflexota bacterium]
MDNIDRPLTTATAPAVRLYKGFGAGAGAALLMILAMALLRVLGVMSIPELLQGAFLRLVPKDVFEYMVQNLDVGAKLLLLVQVLEGMLLAGGVLGYVYARSWRPAGSAASAFARLRANRYQGGALFGLGVGVALVTLFWLLYGLKIFNPLPASDTLLTLNLSLLFYGLVFGLALVALLPWPTATTYVAPVANAAGDRRGFLRMAGGTALALIGGGALWGILYNAEKPTRATLVPEVAGTPGVVSGADATATAATANDIATAVANSGGSFDAIQQGSPAPAQPTGTTALANTTAPANAPTSGPTQAAGSPTDTAGPTQAAVAPADTAVPPTVVAQAQPSPTAFPAVPVLSPEITPTENFYITTKNLSDPDVNAAQWSLTIKGLVEKPQTFTLDQIKAMPQVKVIHTLACISNPVGGNLIGNGRWTGVRLADLMKAARPKSGVADVILRAADEYSDSVPLSILMNQDAMLVYEMNGAPLLTKHGFPARLLIPGIFGMKNLKWVTSIEPVNYDYKGFWESQGWSDPAPYLTMSRIDYPSGSTVKIKPLYVTGIAFAGNRGIQRVEVSVDSGQTWADAQVRRPLGRNTWVLWTYPWIPAAAGDTTLMVRATDGTGAVQGAKDVNNYPNGAEGYHKVAVKIVS